MLLFQARLEDANFFLTLTINMQERRNPEAIV